MIYSNAPPVNSGAITRHLDNVVPSLKANTWPFKHAPFHMNRNLHDARLFGTSRIATIGSSTVVLMDSEPVPVIAFVPRVNAIYGTAGRH